MQGIAQAPSTGGGFGASSGKAIHGAQRHQPTGAAPS